MNKIKIEVNDSTTSHNGNISVEFESDKMEVDKLEGLKENVIVGRLIPAGTGSTKEKWQLSAKERDASLVNPE